MSLMGRIGGLSREALLEEGTLKEVTEKKRRANEEKARPARLKIARSNPRWAEIENDLVGRLGGRWLVSASSDRIYQPVRGAVFLPHSVTAVADQAPLFFHVDDQDELHFFERLPLTWTQHLEKRAARELAKAAPKPRRVPAE